MNLTFKQIRNSAQAVGLLLNSKVIDNFEDAIIIGGLKKPFTEAEEIYNNSINAVQFKFGKLAEARITKDIPDGYNDVTEQEEKLAEIEALLNTVCTVNFDIKPISKETIKTLFNGSKKLDKDNKSTGEKGNCLLPADLSILQELGIVKL